MASRWLTAALLVAPVGAQYGNARRGAEIFERRHCTACHSINGVGGAAAPDLARRSTRDFTPAALASVMWNHAPAMWHAMKEKNLPVPAPTPGEVADLYAYFYSLRYFDPPGDAARGKTVFAEKRCAECHALSAGGETRRGPPVSEWPSLLDPVRWVQEMWNHSGGMAEEREKAGISWPRFTLQEMVDLLVYLQNLPTFSPQPPALALEDPAAGEKLFDQRGCAQCHALGTSEQGRIDLLAAARRARTFTEFAVAMWNHGPQMRRRAARTATEILPFRGDEMNRLIAFLFAQRYFEETGSAGRGRRVFAAKNCGLCHDQPGSGAPSLKDREGGYSPPQMTSALWRHGPKMLAEMEKRGIRWPTFSGREMVDLIAYLNNR